MLLRTRRGLIDFGRARLQPHDEVVRLLDSIAETPAGMHYLRGTLDDASCTPLPEETSDDEILDQVTSQVIEGRLAFVFLRPYDAPTPGFTVEGDATVVTADQQNKAGDLKPAPEIPPEYPKLARLESDQVVDSTGKIVGKLAALLFNSFGRERRQTTIGRQLVLTAAEQSLRIVGARQTTDVSLERGKWPGGGLDRPKPTVPVEYKSAARSTGEMAKVAIDKLAASLAPNDPSKKGRPAPAIPETFVQVASGTAAGTKSAIASLGSSFGSMLHSKPFVRPPSAPVPSEDGG